MYAVVVGLSLAYLYADWTAGTACAVSAQIPFPSTVASLSRLGESCLSSHGNDSAPMSFDTTVALDRVLVGYHAGRHHGVSARLLHHGSMVAHPVDNVGVLGVHHAPAVSSTVLGDRTGKLPQAGAYNACR